MAEKERLYNARVPVLGLVAPSGTGKTILLREVIRLLTLWGLRVGVVKQARADFDVDQPGKDSDRLRKAGVERLLITSSRKSALILEHPDGGDPQLNDLLTLFDQDALDVILVEGFSEQAFPKIAVSRAGKGPVRYPQDPWVIALVTDRVGEMQASVPVLDINDPVKVAEFVVAHVAAGVSES